MYVLDTNAAYYLTDPAWTSAPQLARLQEKVEDGHLSFGLSPITVLEMAARIEDEPERFAVIKESARVMLTLRPEGLPDPEQRMREITEDIALAHQAFQHWLQILETIARAGDRTSLQQGFDDYATATRRSVNVAYIAHYRADYERQYVDDLLRVTREINPAYDKQVRASKMTKLPAREQQALEVFLASPEWQVVFLLLIASRGGSGVAPTDTGRIGVALDKAEYFKRGFEAVMRSTLKDGARPNLKRKNDYNDVHQLIYVNKFTEDVLVSEDAGPIAVAGRADKKVISYREFLAREAVGT